MNNQAPISFRKLKQDARHSLKNAQGSNPYVVALLFVIISTAMLLLTNYENIKYQFEYQQFLATPEHLREEITIPPDNDGYIGVSQTNDGFTYFHYRQSFLPQIASYFVGLISLAFTYYTLRLSRGEPADFRTAFTPLRENFFSLLVLYILMLIYTSLWAMLLIVPGIVKAYAYRQAVYIMLDNPGMSANEAITESRAMMDGRKWEMFLLDLSFLGWILPPVLVATAILVSGYSVLGFWWDMALVIGITFLTDLYIMPYMQTTYSHYYNCIRGYVQYQPDFDAPPTFTVDDYYPK